MHIIYAFESFVLFCGHYDLFMLLQKSVNWQMKHAENCNVNQLISKLIKYYEKKSLKV